MLDRKNKTQIIDYLVELGLIDEAKIIEFEGKSYDTASLNRAIKKLDIDSILELCDKKLISVKQFNEVKIK
jgi:hypothetical protein